MKTRLLCFWVLFLVLAAGSALAQMGGGGMGPGSGSMPGPMPGPSPGPTPGPGSGHMGYGKGYGMRGIGGMGSMMYGNAISYGHLDALNPIKDGDPTDAKAAFQAFIQDSNSSLQISHLWEYGTVYKAELMDTTGAMAFDLMADKFTGVVMPEMGLSMMLNASYGKNLYKTTTFGKNLSLSPAQATANAQTFVDNNKLGYTLETPEIYPGYYKFHTKHGNDLGMDIMVDGYDGGVWMESYLGMPINKY